MDINGRVRQGGVCYAEPLCWIFRTFCDLSDRVRIVKQTIEHFQVAETRRSHYNRQRLAEE